MFRDDPNERLYFYRPESLPGVEVLSAFGSSQGWHVYHERYAVCACRTADAGWKYRGRQRRLVDGSVAFMEPGEVHRNTDVRKIAEFKVVFLDAAAFEAVPHFRVSQTEDRAVYDAVYRFCHAVDRQTPVLEQQTRLTLLIEQLSRYREGTARPAGTPDSRALLRVRDYLVDRFSESVTLSQLAAAAGMSRFHLLRAFTQKFGLPPHQFLVHVRTERAAALLRMGMLPVDAATAVGFADQSHLTRHFRRIWRVTPGAYAHA